MNKIRKHNVSTVLLIIGFTISFLAMYYGMQITSIIADENAAASTMQFHFQKAYQLNLLSEGADVTKLVSENFPDGNAILYDSTAYINQERAARLIDIVMVSNEDLSYDLKTGSYPSKEEISSGQRMVILGEEMEDFVYQKGNESYIDVAGEAYKVKGIVTIPNSHVLDYKVIIYNMGSILQQQIQSTAVSYGLNLLWASNTTDIVEPQITGDLLCSEVAYDPFVVHTEENTISLYSFVIYLFSIGTCIIFSQFWMWTKEKELIVLRTFGYSTVQLMGKIIKELAVMLVYSVLLSCILLFLLLFIEKDNYLSLGARCSTLLKVIPIFMVISLVITSIYPLRLIQKGKNLIEGGKLL